MSPSVDAPGDDAATGAARSFASRAWQFFREHPYMIGLILLSTIGGAVLAPLLPLGELSTARKCIGGAVTGFYFALFPLGFRLFD